MAGASGASANVISFNATVGPASTNFNDTLHIQQFDPSLGTLTGIHFTLNGTVQGTVQVESQDSSPSTVTSSLQATITVTRPDLSTLIVVVPLFSQIDSLSAFDGVVDFGGTSGATHTGLVGTNVATADSPPPASDLALFTGLGFIDLPVSAVGTSSANGAGNLITQFQTSATAELTVDYTFTTNTTVAEPATLTLLGLGLTGFTMLRRRRRS